jgi:YegS/Rv2252/BmrU family lipid kinase
MKTPKMVCIMNPAAGTRRGVRQTVEQALSGAAVDFVFHETRCAGHAFQLAQEAIALKAGSVIGIGGDGTLNEVAKALVNTQVPLGVIPVGSGNAFARALKISTIPKKACCQLLNALPRRLDVGMVESDVFLSTAGVGLDAEVARGFAARKGKRRGLMPYVMLALNAIQKSEREPLRLIWDDHHELVCRPLGLVVANTAQYGNGAIIAPGACPNDGLLDVCVIEPTSSLSMMIHARRLFTGSFHQMPGVRRFQVRKIRVERVVPGYYQCDGEALEGPAHLNFEVKPEALSVLLPNRQ